MNQLTFNAAQLSDYVQTLGWIQVVEAAKDGLYVYNHADFGPLQLVFAMSENFRDSDETLLRAATRLAQIYELTPDEAFVKIEESGDEVLNARVPDENQRRVVTVSLLYAAQVMEGQKKMLLAGAIANAERRAFYSNKATGDAKTLMEAARFRHTERGSFVFKTSCSLYAVEGEGNIPIFSPEEAPLPQPFVRRAMLNLGIGLEELVSSIQNRKTDQLVEQVKEQKDSSVSANLCRAIGELRDEEHPHAVDFSISWSPLLPPPPEAPRQIIRVVPDYFPIIEEIGKELQPVKKPVRDTYVATVDELSGAFNNLLQREGRVTLTLLLAGGETMKVRVTLDAEKYDEAVAVHKTSTVYASVTGTIEPRQRQPYGFNLEAFKIINAPNPTSQTSIP
ncbi:MAG TPA: hypothetical protein VF627_06725 [Abditibacterium sp.]|jgi:hypothetical protein